MAEGRHIENYFSATSRRHIDKFGKMNPNYKLMDVM